MNKKVKVNTNVVYLVGLLSYIVIVVNMFTTIPVLQLLNGFATGLANLLAVVVIPFLLVLIIGIVVFKMVSKKFKDVTSSTFAKFTLDRSEQNEEYWNDLEKVKLGRFSRYTLAFWILFILAILGGGTFTAVILLLIALCSGVLKSVAGETHDEYLRLVKLVEDKEEEEK
jgi:hypothetical protein